MKQLIFTLLLFPSFIQADVNGTGTDKVKELTDQELSKKFVTTIRDLNIETTLERSSEFNECVKNSKFSPNETQQEREDKAKVAEACFTQKLEGKSPDEIEKLSSTLGLQSYGLVQGKDQKAIRNYLANKLHKALTGTDRNQQANNALLKFENRKQVDQKVFIELYFNHVAKAVMFEISRFCFENLRNTDGATTSFVDHWKDFFVDDKPLAAFSLKDDGQDAFGFTTTTNVADKEKAYEAMFKGIGTATSPDKLGKFFEECAMRIKPLCDQFRASSSTASSTSNVGANACLSLTRLQEGKKAVTKARLIKEQFDNDLNGGISIAGSGGTFFQPDALNSITSLSTVTSYDILEGGKDPNDKFDKLKQKCSQTPEASECKDYLVVDDSKDKAAHEIEIDLRLKKQMELARLKKLNGQPLEKYLEENGYLDILDKVKQGQEVDFEKEVGKLYDAKRIALIESMNTKLGKRQMNQKEYDANQDKQAIMEASLKEAETERARMSQVVLFNNIVTGFLTAQVKGSNQTVRFGASWKNEEKGLESANIAETHFQNYKDSFQDDNGASGNTTIEDLSFLDSFLGAPAATP